MLCLGSQGLYLPAHAFGQRDGGGKAEPRFKLCSVINIVVDKLLQPLAELPRIANSAGDCPRGL